MTYIMYISTFPKTYERQSATKKLCLCLGLKTDKQLNWNKTQNKTKTGEFNKQANIFKAS